MATIFLWSPKQSSYLGWILQPTQQYDMKSEVLGPEASMKQEVRIMNRTLRWRQSSIEYEADDKHAKNIIQEYTVLNRRTSRPLGAPDHGGVGGADKEKTFFRGVAARENCLALDRREFQFAAKDLCKHIASPRTFDWEKVRKIARNLKGKPRAFQHVLFGELASQLGGCADSDWAGERPSMKSTSGVMVMWVFAWIKSRPCTQTTIALSSAEAELCAFRVGAVNTLSLWSASPLTCTWSCIQPPTPPHRRC